MPADREDAPLALDAPDDVRRLRDALHAAGFTPAGVAGLLKLQAEDLRLSAVSAPGKERALALIRAAGDDPLSVLVRLFLLGAEIDESAAHRALTPATAEALVAVGLLEQRAGGFAAALQLLPFNQFWMAADPLWAGDIHPKHVVSAGGPSLALAQTTVRRPVRSTLDVGCGCGVQAFLAAAHSESVIGVDRNPRAVNVSAFNAQLNGLDHCRFVAGDLYAPVQGQRFDLIVANPPYVISPGSEFIYRDSGLKGDEIARRVIREGAELLEEGGYLQLTCEWAHLAGTDWQARLAGWFAGTGCDACVLRFTTVGPDEHSALWLRSDPHITADGFAKRYGEWVAYHHAQGIEAISDGVISLRKRSGGRNWVRIDDAPPRVGGCGWAVERAFAAADFLTATGDDRVLLDSRVRLAPEAGWEQRLFPTPDGWEVRHSQLFLATGLTARGDATQQGITLVELCDGQRTVREALTGLAAAGGPPLEQAAQTLGVVRHLIEQGFLLPC